MPKAKFYNAKSKSEEIIVYNLNITKKLLGAEKLALILGLSNPTSLYQRLKNPSALKAVEVLKICNTLKISPNDFLNTKLKLVGGGSDE